MNTVFIVLIIASLLTVLLSRPLRLLHIQGPVILVAAGVLTGQFTHFELAATLNSHAAQYAAELILAVLLFVEATSVKKGRLWGDDPRTVARLICVGLPLSLATTVLAGSFLMPQLPWSALLVVACVITPIDFAPATWIVRDRRIPGRVRSALKVEGGYNDGIISPIFLFSLSLAGAESAENPLNALAAAVPSFVMAILAGALVGGVLAVLLSIAAERHWTDPFSARLTIVLVPLLTYLAAVNFDSNGFVASFVSGIAFRAVHEWLGKWANGASWESDFQLIEDSADMLSLGMWFVFGNVAVLVVLVGITWQATLLAVLALTILRLGPVLLATVGSRLRVMERFQLGLLAPRGTTTIVFGLLAFNGLPDGELADTAVVAMAVTVLGSVLLHNLAGLGLRKRFRES